MKDLKAIKGRYYIQGLIEQGEHEQQDFKFAISDARKIARSVSAFANNSGGRLLIGVKDNGNIAGVRNEEDIYVVEQAATMYCRPEVEVQFQAYRTDPGVTVIKVTVPKAQQRPVCVSEADGTMRAYFRVADQNIVAHPLMVRAWRLRENPEDSTALQLDREAAAVIDAVTAGAPGPVSPARIAIAASMSQRTADAVIVRLAAAGILDFRYDGHSFGIIRCED